MPLIPAPVSSVEHNGQSLEVVPTFCYLGDMTSSGGGCLDATTSRIKSAWKSFRELLPILTSKSISCKYRGLIFHSCVRRVLLYAGETWPVLAEDVRRLTTNDNAMVKWMLGKRLKERSRMADNHQALSIVDVETTLRRDRYVTCAGMSLGAPSI